MKNPCWKGYKNYGTKMKDGKKVPNCVKEYTISSQSLIERIVAYCNRQNMLHEAEYQGRTVQLNKPMKGDVKKYKVYVKNPKTGQIVKVNFGDKNMEIKRDDPERRKNFRARHNCADKKDKTSAGYWSCKFWSNKKVSDMV
jgi:hypothetical protein